MAVTGTFQRFGQFGDRAVDAVAGAAASSSAPPRSMRKTSATRCSTLAASAAGKRRRLVGMAADAEQALLQLAVGGQRVPLP